MKTPQVSVIIPLHNNEAHIVEAIESCFWQSHDNFEVIVVENGSSDASYSKVAALNDVRLQLYQIETPNAAAARNYGFRQATGDYVMFLDADDVLAKNKIESQLKVLAQKPEGWVASCPWAKFTNNIQESLIIQQRVWEVKSPLDWCVSSWTGGGMMIPGCWLIPKQLIAKAGLWNERLSLHDDGEFMSRVLLASNGNIFVEETVVYYRQVAGSLSRQNSDFKAANSALAVYKSYEQSILALHDCHETRQALAYNYRRFIYEFYPNHKDLINKARKRLSQLEVSPLPIVGGKKFIMLAKLIGFNSALALKRIFK
jgi:glycosyltransferase involved in cell wall biosynthesis